MKIRKLSPVECFALLFMVIFTYLLVDDWLLHPINSEKKPINLHDVKPIIDRQMTVVTVGLQGFVSEENLTSQFQAGCLTSKDIGIQIIMLSSYLSMRQI